MRVSFARSSCTNKKYDKLKACKSHLFLPVLEIRKSDIMVPADLVTGENLFPQRQGLLAVSL